MAPRDNLEKPLETSESAIKPVTDPPSTYPGIYKYPTGRDTPFRLAEDWIEGNKILLSPNKFLDQFFKTSL